MIALIRPSRTLLAACLVGILHTSLAAQDSTIPAIIKANAVAPQPGFFKSIPPVRKMPVTRMATVNPAQHQLVSPFNIHQPQELKLILAALILRF
jgi:hypothetical protein